MTSRNYPRRILLAVTGMSPQIVTETLYALAVQPQLDDIFIPTEIHILTTSTGAREAKLNLLTDQQGWFLRLCQDYKLPEIDFSANNIHILADQSGKHLDDIRTPQDNEIAADFITEQIRLLTQDNNSSLHVSIAGGRKTMGYYMGYAMSLFGRPQDHLSHVLVSEPFEGNKDFFYPTPYEHPIRVSRGERQTTHDARDAKIELANIPFVRLRGGVPKHLQEGTASFSQVVSAAQRILEKPSLEISYAAQKIFAAGESIKMEPSNLAFYSMMARRRKNGQHAISWQTDGIAEEFLAELSLIIKHDSGEFERVKNSLLSQVTLKDWFEQRKSRVNTSITDVIGETLSAPYIITSQGKRPNTRHGIILEMDVINFLK